MKLSFRAALVASSCFALTLVAIGCLGDDPITSAPPTSSEGGTAPAGQRGGPCVDGTKCVEGLTCVDSFCAALDAGGGEAIDSGVVGDAGAGDAECPVTNTFSCGSQVCEGGTACCVATGTGEHSCVSPTSSACGGTAASLLTCVRGSDCDPAEVCCVELSAENLVSCPGTTQSADSLCTTSDLCQTKGYELCGPTTPCKGGKRCHAVDLKVGGNVFALGVCL